MEKEHLTFQSKDKKYSEALVSKGSLPATAFKRATALLELNRGKSLGAAAAALGGCYQGVSSWRAAYRENGFAMLHDEPRSGRPIEIERVNKGLK